MNVVHGVFFFFGTLLHAVVAFKGPTIANEFSKDQT
jgi:hypothetical protein